MASRPMIERRVEVRRVVSRFPSGEVRVTEPAGERWVPFDAQASDPDEVWCAPSDSNPVVRVVK
jgi:hypothetical protein